MPSSPEKKAARNREASRRIAEARAAEVRAMPPKPCAWCEQAIPIEVLLRRSTAKYCGKRCNDKAAKSAMAARQNAQPDGDEDERIARRWAQLQQEGRVWQ